MEERIFEILSHLSYLNAGIFLIVVGLWGYAIYGTIVITRNMRAIERAVRRSRPDIID